MESSSTTPRLETDRYRAILDAAEKLFVEKGYHTVSVEQIAEVAGVSKGLVHYHFTTKEQLLVSILKDILDELFTRLESIIKKDDTAQARMKMFIEAYLNLACSRSGLARVTFFDDALTEQAKIYIATRAEENVLKLTGLVDDGIAKGEFSSVDSRLVSNLITGVILEVIRESVMKQQTIVPVEISEKITGILCNGIKS